MYGTESQIDANFYRMIHQLAGVPRPGTPADRRGRSRQAFFADHRIAPVYGDEFPDDSAFIRVRCYDLTRSGFSFFVPTRPDFTALVAAFGDPPDAIFVGARVIRCENVVVHPLGLVERVHGRPRRAVNQSPTGEVVVPMVLVGCHFTRRLEGPPAPGDNPTAAP